MALLLPANDVESPELTICVPALNEELTIGDFVDWCHQGIRGCGVVGEILIVDSSSDSTSEIAVQKGARVLKTPRRGLGRAYIDSLRFVRGKYLILGDCDCTYDFRELRPFVENFQQGAEFIMGSRFRGYIEPGAMPPLHRYLGTPVTTWILNFMYSSRFSDIHCGMRGITQEAFRQMDLQSQSWEYASEMVLKSVHMELKTAEIPIRFLKDRAGRLSHLKRGGWLSPWKAAWINLRAMFVFGPDFFLYRPGLILLSAGLIVVITLSAGPVRIGRITFSLYSMLLGQVMLVLGLQCVYLGVIAKLLFDFTGRDRDRWLRLFPYNRSVLISAAMLAAGIALFAPLIIDYFQHGLTLPLVTASSYLAIAGLSLMICAFMTFAFTLLLHATEVSMRKRR